MRRRRGIELKSPGEFQAMRAAGLVVADTLERLGAAAAPGVTTAELDELARDCLAAAGATSSFLGYGHPPFPGVICASVNEEVVHGVPGGRALAPGDIISIDFGAIVDGWHGDAAVTLAVGDVAPADLRLSEVTRGSLWAGIAAAAPGGRLSDVSHAVETSIRSSKRPDGGQWGILREYGGHGIGSQMHMEPHLLNFGPPNRGPRLVPGMAIAIEPMVTLGSEQVELAEDSWTVVTGDGSRSAHWEHTVAITADGPWVLTALDGGAALLAELGVATPATGAAS